ncbi:MAG TPA: 50S ribosome-binding protein YggL [Gemmatimonadales bacterium]
MSGACPELGFDVRIRPHDRVAGEAGDALLRDLLDGLVEERGLVAEVRGRGAWLVTVTRDAGQATEADREAISAWAAGRREIARCEVGPLVDLSGTR